MWARGGRGRGGGAGVVEPVVAELIPGPDVDADPNADLP